MDIPSDKKTFDGEIATYWFEDDVLVSLSKSIKRTVANISGNVALVKAITNKKKVPILIYLKNSPIPDKETRIYSAEQLPNIYSAMAMISEPGLSQFIINILFKLKKPPIPMKNFTDVNEEKDWLKRFVNQDNEQ